MDFRKTFDCIPGQFDRWRPRYCPELFSEVIRYAGIGPQKSVLEIGPGTGQATEPFLKTGCRYEAIELGEHFAAFMRERFSRYAGFHLVEGDFETHDFGEQAFDLVFSAATIQWISEEIAFPKVFSLLRPGGTLAMFMTRTDEKTPNGPLYDAIQRYMTSTFMSKRATPAKWTTAVPSATGLRTFIIRTGGKPASIARRNMPTIWPPPRWSISPSRSPAAPAFLRG